MASVRPPAKKARGEAKVKEEPRGAKGRAARAAPAKRTLGPWEMRYGENEVVAVLAPETVDNEETRGKGKFFVGRLGEDLLIQTESTQDVGILWFDEKDGHYTPREEMEDTPAGAIICSLAGRIKIEVDENGEADSLCLGANANEFVLARLEKQLQDDYQSDQDSHFGDEVVLRRLGRGDKVIKIEDDDNDDDDDSDNENSGKGRKTGPKKKKAPAKKKKGKGKEMTPRTNIELVENVIDEAGPLRSFDGDVQRATRDLVRVIRSGNVAHIKAALNQTDLIAGANAIQSVDVCITTLQHALIKSDEKAFKMLYDKMKSSREAWADLPQAWIARLSTGSHTSRYSRYNRRKINASRGGKEGNNAFASDLIQNKVNVKKGSTENTHDLFMIHSDDIPLDVLRDFDPLPASMLDMLEKSTNFKLDAESDSFMSAVLAGDRALVERFIQFNKELDELNHLHLDVLSESGPKDPKDPFGKTVRQVSVTKKGPYPSRVMPLNLACINPDPVWLKALLEIAPESVTQLDGLKRSLLHYCAVCSSSKPLEYVLATAPHLDVNGIGARTETPLLLAARAARPDNVDLLLKSAEEPTRKVMLNQRSGRGEFTVLQEAMMGQRKDRFETVKVLLAHGANLDAFTKTSKAQAVHLVAKLGDLEMLQYLYKSGANVQAKDKLGRTPLMFACKNGHAHVVSWLLRIGVDAEDADTSSNVALHYAAAFGWVECVKLLADANVDLNAANMWNTTPLMLSLQKNFKSVSAFLIRCEKVDVNVIDGIDDTGCTLFMRLVMKECEKLGTLSDKLDTATALKVSRANLKKVKGAKVQSVPDFLSWDLKELLSRKDIDISKPRKDGENVIHVISKQKFSSKLGRTQALELLFFLASRGADLNQRNDKGEQPIVYAVLNNNVEILEALSERGASLSNARDASGSNVLHTLLSRDLKVCETMFPYIEKASTSVGFEQLFSQVNHAGFTPLLVAIERLASEGGNIASRATSQPKKRTRKAFDYSDSEESTAEEDSDSDSSDSDNYDRKDEAVNKAKNDAVMEDASSSESSTVAFITSLLKRFKRHVNDSVLPEIRFRDTHALLEHLKTSPIDKSEIDDVDAPSSRTGLTALHFVCHLENSKVRDDMVKVLLQLGASVSSADRIGCPPLQVLLRDKLTSVKGLHKELEVLDTAKLLIDAGAEVEHHSSFPFESEKEAAEWSFEKQDDRVIRDQVALAFAQELEKGKQVAPDAMEVDVGGDKEELTEVSLVDSYNELMFAREKKRFKSAGDVLRPLAMCLSKVTPTSLEKIATFGVDLSAVHPTSGDTILHITCADTSLKPQALALLRLIPKAISVENKAGKRPLHIIVQNHQDTNLANCILEILPAGEVDAPDTNGTTALHLAVSIAAERDHEPIEAMEDVLLAAGASATVLDKNGMSVLHYSLLGSQALSSESYNFPSFISGGPDPVSLLATLLAAKGVDEKLVCHGDVNGRTALHVGAARNALVSCLLLCDHGADLYVCDKDGNTAFNVALMQKLEPFAVTMLKSQPAERELVPVQQVRRTRNEKGEVTVVEKTSFSPFSLTLQNKFGGLVFLLLARVPLHTAVIDGLRLGAHRVVQKILRTANDTTVMHVDERGRSLLHEVAQYTSGDDSSIKWSLEFADILLARGVDASIVDNEGNIALHVAARSCNFLLCKKLCELQWDATGKPDPRLLENTRGWVPASCMFVGIAEQGDIKREVFELFDLLVKPFDTLSEEITRVQTLRPPTQKERSEFLTRVPFTLKDGPNRSTIEKEIAEEAAKRDAERGKKDSGTSDVKTIDVTKFCVDSNEEATSFTSWVTVATILGAHKLLYTLLGRGASPNITDSNGLYPLHYAAIRGDAAATTILLRSGADIDTAVAEGHPDAGATPLSFAVLQSSNDVSLSSTASLLTKYGADVGAAKTPQGYTIVHFASATNDLATVKALLSIQAQKVVPQKPKGKVVDLRKHLDKGGVALVRFGNEPMFLPVVPEKGEIKLLLPGQSAEKCELFPCQEEHITQVIAAEPLKLDTESALQELAKEKEVPMNLLREYSSFESALLGDQDPMLTKPLKVGQQVLYIEENYVCDARVTKAYANLKYQVVIFRGQQIDDVPRTKLRPFDGSSITVDRDESRLEAFIKEPDSNGNTLLSLALHPCKFGSFEDIALVKYLVEEVGAKVDSKLVRKVVPVNTPLRSYLEKHMDSKGKSKTMAAHHEALHSPFDDEETSVVVLQGKSLEQAELETDCSEALQKLYTLQGDQAAEELAPKVSSVCELKSSGLRVLPVADAKDEWYNVVLIKVKVSYVGYGENNFYKMQIVHDKEKGVHVLINNWGRIGENPGKFQQTPFTSEAEAIKEFAKVFRSKTGNKWEDRHDFEAKTKKYKPVPVPVEQKNPPALPDVTKVLSSRVEKVAKPSFEIDPALENLMLEIIDPAKVSAAASNCGLEQQKTPLGQLSLDRLAQAEAKLREIKVVFEETDGSSANDTVDSFRQRRERLAGLTAQFYELVPTSEEYSDMNLAPFEGKSDGRFLAAEKMIFELRSLTVAAMMVNASFSKRKVVHPIEYCLRALNADIAKLSVGNSHRLLVEQYFRQTIRDKDLFVNEVFAVKRHSDQPLTALSNRKLLWHGTPSSNLAGVLRDGLRVAPPESAQSGQTYGMGVYFADVAGKSWAYSRAALATQYDPEAPAPPKGYMILSEVALGKQRKVGGFYDTEEEDEKESYDSVLAVGNVMPKERHNITLQDSGLIVPLGAITRVSKRTPVFYKQSYREFPSEEVAKIEAVRNNRETTFPAEVAVNFQGRKYKACIKQGPEAKEVTLEPVLEEGEEDSVFVMRHRERTLYRKEGFSGYGDSEYVVPDPKRINIKYIVEVSSKAWFESRARYFAKEAEEDAKAK